MTELKETVESKIKIVSGISADLPLEPAIISANDLAEISASNSGTVGTCEPPTEAETNSAAIAGTTNTARTAGDIDSANTASFTPPEPNGNSQSAANEEIGKVIDGRFEVISLLGIGGMSKVFKAHDLESGNFVALKLITPERLKDEKNVDRFRQEAETIKLLEHENICSVTKFGQDADKQPYLIMEYVDGLTLADVLRIEGALDTSRAIEIVKQVCAGLSHAHARGVVHRDIKPSNIILSKDKDGKEQVRILDFGIARVFDQVATAHAPLTETGEFLGTPWYMSPEQCFGQITDARSDAYQVGCLLYESLTGKRPYEGSNAFEVMFKHVTGLPGLEGIEEELQAIIAKTLEKNPENRYHSISELSKELHLFAVGRLARNAKKHQDWKKVPLKELIARRTSAAVIDALIVGTISSSLIYVMQAAKLIERGYLTYDPVQLEVQRTFAAFILGFADSFLVWPSLILSVIPSRGWDLMNAFHNVPGFDALYAAELPVVPLTVLIVSWLYSSNCERSRLKGTAGKVLAGLQVQTTETRRLTFLQATTRHFSKAISMLVIPQLLVYFLALMKKGMKTAGEELRQEIRQPLHDKAGSFFVSKGDRRGKARLVITTILAAVAALGLFQTAPWAACQAGNYNLAIQLNPKFAEAYEQRAEHNVSQQEFKAALSDLEATQRIFPNRPELYLKEAGIYMRMHNYSAATEACKRGIKNVKMRDSCRLRVILPEILAMSQGDFVEAEDAARDFQKTLGHRDFTAMFLRASLLAKLSNNPKSNAEIKLQLDNVVDSANERISWTSSDDPGKNPVWPDVYLDLASTALLRNDLSTALVNCDKAISQCDFIKTLPYYDQATYLKRYRSEAILLRADIYQRMGNHAQAQADYKQGCQTLGQILQDTLKKTAITADDTINIGRIYLRLSHANEMLENTALAKEYSKEAASCGVVYDIDIGY